MIMPAPMWKLKAFGTVGSSMLILMLRCLTQLQLPNATSVFNPVIIVWKLERDVNTKTEYYMAPSHPSSSPPLVAWVPLPLLCFERLASLLSIKWDELYSKTILFIRCQLGFALLRSAIRCLRGSRSTFTTDLVNTLPYQRVGCPIELFIFLN